MIFDVGVRLGYNEAGKAINRYYRVHDTILSESIRKAQDAGQYIFSIIPLFRKKVPLMMKDLKSEHDYGSERDLKDPIDDRIMIDPHGY